MVLMDAFIAGDVYIDYRFEDAKFRYEKATGKVFCRLSRKAEEEIPPDDDLYHHAISSGKQITREEYFRD